MRGAGVEGTTTLGGAAIGDYLARTGIDLDPVDACFDQLFPQRSGRRPRSPLTCCDGEEGV